MVLYVLLLWHLGRFIRLRRVASARLDRPQPQFQYDSLQIILLAIIFV
jgi:hypothetical protein